MDFKICFGSPEAFEGSENDLFAVIDRLVSSGAQLPKLHLSIGTEDYLYETNTSFRQKLDACNIPYVYTECPGKHEWSMWDRRIQDVLDWLPVVSQKPIGNGMAELLELERQAAPSK